MEILMNLINKDSKKYTYISYPIFDQILFEELKVKYLEKYSSFLPKRSSPITRVYTINEFVDLLIKNNIKNICNDIELFTFIRKKEKEFFNKIGYLEKLHEKKDKFKKAEILCIENKSCMFMKNNNFIEWLTNPLIIKLIHDFKERLSISKELQKQIWEKEYGANTSGKCVIYGCDNILNTNVSNSWQCGHIISHNNGGSTTLDNLRPLCTPCNRTMSDTNWNEYETQLKRKDIIENYFDDETTEIKCKSKLKCGNKVNESTFEILQTKNKVKPICIECSNK